MSRQRIKTQQGQAGRSVSRIIQRPSSEYYLNGTIRQSITPLLEVKYTGNRKQLGGILRFKCRTIKAFPYPLRLISRRPWR